MDKYYRQNLLPEIGIDGQRKLASARILIVGAGGLGSPVALYLCGAGVGTLALVDDDCVTLHNLHRQVLYTQEDVGKPKVSVAARRLRALNSDVSIEEYPCRLTSDNAFSIISRYDIVVDGCDNFSTRYLLNDVCSQLQKPYVYGAIRGFTGQVSIFCCGENYHSYCELFPKTSLSEQESKEIAPIPVVGTTAAVVGSVEAHEVLKLICGYGSPLIGKLWTIDLLSMNSYVIDL